jgi:hypothetical protein
MSDDDVQEPEQRPQPEFQAANWEVGETKVVLEEDGIRVTVELLPRVEGAEATKAEIFMRPF